MPKRTTTLAVATPAVFTGNTHTARPARYRIVGQDKRDLTIIGADLNLNTLVRSTDDAATWQALNGHVFQTAPDYIGHTDDGEVVVGTIATLAHGASIWKSSGWARNPATATFTKTLQFTTGLNLAYGGFEVKGNVVFISEYGPQGDDPAVESARRAYLSTDAGRTFTQVFDLDTVTVAGQDTPWGSPTRRQHLHGCAYDQQWDRLWLVVGDASGPSGVCAVIYSDDWGSTWQAYPETVSTIAHWQSVLPDSLDNAIVFASDFDANGLRRIGRSGYRKGTGYGAAHLFDGGTGIRVIGIRKHQAPGQKNAPHLYTFAAVTADYPGGVVGTLDEGRTFHTLYKDPNRTGASLDYRGATTCVGPTNTGRYVTEFNDLTRYPTGSVMVSELQTTPLEAPASNGEVFISAASLYSTVGAPVPPSPLTAIYGFPSWRLPSSDRSTVAAMIGAPDGWKTYRIEVVYSNPGTNSGNIAWRLDTKEVSAVGSQYFPPDGVIAPHPLAGGVGVTTSAILATGVTSTQGKFQNVILNRITADDADTFPDDVFVHGLRLIRES